MRGKQRRVGAGRRCLSTSQQGALQLYVTEVGTGPWNTVFSGTNFHEWPQQSLWNGAHRQVKNSMAAWMSLRCALGIHRKKWGGCACRGSLGWEQGRTRPPSSLLVLHSLYVVGAESPIQTFFQTTNQATIHIHAITNSAPLQVTHRESKQRFSLKVHSLSFTLRN